MAKVKKILGIAKGDRVLCAYAQRAAGPGWANSPLWVVIRKADGSLSEECIQPEERTAAMHWLYDVLESAHVSMVTAINQAIQP